jgi:hypothetical protein
VPVDDGIWLVSFLDFFDQKEDRVERGPNPFTPGESVNLSLRNKM